MGSTDGAAHPVGVLLVTASAFVWSTAGWLAFGETPTTAALIGGFIVLGAVVGCIVAESRAVPARREVAQRLGDAERGGEPGAGVSRRDRS